MVRRFFWRADDGDADRGELVLVVLGHAPHARLLVGGELDVATAPRLARFLDDLLRAGHRRLDLDLSRVRLLAAAGLTVVLEATARFEQAGGRLRLTATTARIDRILHITGLDLVLDVQASRPRAPRSPGVRRVRGPMPVLGGSRRCGLRPGRVPRAGRGRRKATWSSRCR